MFMKIGLVPIIAAAALALAGCGQAPTNNAVAAEANSASSSGGAPAGGVCGGIGNIQCAAANDFCETPAGQCAPDAQGACTARPGACTQPYEPVCGCNGRTYGNACQAAVAGTSVQAQGACPEPAGSDANAAAAAQ